MKCKHCGFTYDDETICPICGTPAEKPTQTAANNPYAEPSAPAVPAVKETEMPVPPQPPKHSKVLMIVLTCAVSVIAACMLYSTIAGIVSRISRAEKDKERDKTVDRVVRIINDLLDSYDAADALGLLNNDFSEGTEDEGFFSFDDSDETEEIKDSAAHAVGEGYDFGKGVVSLKSAAVSQDVSNTDKTLQQVKFTLEVTNNTKEQQYYDNVNLMVNDMEFDNDHYAFAELDNDPIAGVAPGASCHAYVYYNLPKDNRQLTCEVSVYGRQTDGYRAVSTYLLKADSIR